MLVHKTGILLLALSKASNSKPFLKLKAAAKVIQKFNILFVLESLFNI